MQQLPALKLPLLAITLAFGFAIGPAHAVDVPSGFTNQQVAGGIDGPTALTVLPDGRVLVVRQNGAIRIIKNDTLLPTNFYTVQNVNSSSEHGCLGVTYDPNFAANHYIYLNCTIANETSSHNRIFRVTEANDVALPGSEQTILDLPDIPEDNQFHIGGALRFGADGKLYVSVGNHENTPQPADSSNSQNLSNPFGKILRINPDGSVPSDNPFVNTPDAYAAIFAFGLRNPFSFDIQPGTGLMLINDVGEVSWEEIDRGASGANYGWPASEGNEGSAGFSAPLYTYSHDKACAITGGAFYNPSTPQFPVDYVGKYFFADFCGGWIKTIDPANPANVAPFASGIGNPVNLSVAPDGSLYYLARNQAAGSSSGTVGKIVSTAPIAPLAAPADTTPDAGTALAVPSSGGGGGCSIGADGRFDPTLFSLAAALGWLRWRRRKTAGSR